MIFRVPWILATLCAVLFVNPPLGLSFEDSTVERVYFGTYRGSGGKGIYFGEFDAKTGALSVPRLAAEIADPSFLAISPNRKFLYAVSEISDLGGKKTGGVSAFVIDAASGALKPINEQPSMGAGPCHLTVDRGGKAVLVANYGAGSVASLPIRQDGGLEPAASAIQHQGKSVDPNRQEGPHAHSINLDPGDRFAFAADLGLDKVLIYKFDAKAGTLAANDPPSASVAPGAGPRHFAFHPSGKFAYVINEMANTVTGFSFDAKRGALKEIQTIGTLPDGYAETSYTAEVQVHPSGKYLYGSNRGHDSIAAFRIDEKTGKLTSIGQTPTGGKTPRNFGLHPGGKFLLAANQESDTVVVFAIDPATGEIGKELGRVSVPKPCCVKFWREKSE